MTVGSLTNAAPLVARLSLSLSRMEEGFALPWVVDALAASPASDARESFAALAASLQQLTTVLQSLAGAQLGAIQALVNGVDALIIDVGGAAESLDTAGQSVTSRVEQLAERQLSAAAAALRGGIGDLQDGLERALSESHDRLVSEITDQLNSAGDQATEAIFGSASRLVEGLGARFSDVRTKVTEDFQSRVEGAGRRAIEAVAGDMIHEIADNVALIEVSTSIATTLSGVMPQLVALSAAAQAIKEALRLLRAGF